MKLHILIIVLAAYFWNVTFVSTFDTTGFLESHICHEPEDCYITDGLHLSCWTNLKKCKCDNTILSPFVLEFQDGKCLSSKYGPCGQREGEGSTLEVGCLDGFHCIENKCRDPSNPSILKQVPLKFERTCKRGRGCHFAEDLDLTCDIQSSKCVCEELYMADVSSSDLWDIYNYDGDKECTIEKFGPCGEKDGIKIECHGTNLACVSGTCLDPNHPISVLNEDCEYNHNCEEGLLCSLDRKCIRPKSLEEGDSCHSEEDECSEGLICFKDPMASPWDLPTCEVSDEKR